MEKRSGSLPAYYRPSRPRYLKAVGDPRKVVRNPEARHFGAVIAERTLVPLGEARLGRITLDERLRHTRAAA
jgi:hypothetical protein